MALGDLSPDQARYRDLMVAATGLDPTVVTAWIGSESAWGTTKAGHNYLNVGPGETYPTVEQAAARAASLIDSQTIYAGIRAAIPTGPNTQVTAIGQSRWGTSATVLTKVYTGLTGATTAPAATDVSLHIPIPGTGGLTIPTPGDAVGALAGATGSVVKAGINLFMSGALGLVFTIGALALVALGLSRLTGTPARDRFSQASQVAGSAATAATFL